MNKHKFNLRARVKSSPVYPMWVLLGQFTTDEEKSSLVARMGKHYDEFQVEPLVNERES